MSEWLDLIDQWVSVPTPDNLLNFGLLQDFRAIKGDLEMEGRVRQGLLERANDADIFLARLARNVTRFPPALGMFDRFVVEKKGENKGKLNLKRAGIFTITEGVNLMAMDMSYWHGTTWDKLDWLRSQAEQV